MEKIAFISGATAGIGKATACLLAENKYNLILTGRRKERLADFEQKLTQEYGIKVLSKCFDVRKYDEVKLAIYSLTDECKNIDVLINNAGLAAGYSDIQDGNLEDWEAMIDMAYHVINAICQSMGG